MVQNVVLHYSVPHVMACVHPSWMEGITCVILVYRKLHILRHTEVNILWAVTVEHPIWICLRSDF